MAGSNDDRAAPDRRTVLAAMTGLSLAASAAAAAAQPAEAGLTPFDYLFLDLGAGPRPAFVTHLKSVATPLVEAADGEILGLFNPQLGWGSTEAAVLIRWKSQSPARAAALAAITGAPQVSTSRREPLSATLRPGLGDRPAPGGIYVHRWFDVATAQVGEFVDLSGQGWRDFESRFATKIFGLFRAPRTAPDEQRGVTRLLLLTRYASHGVWEDSRDPSTEAMGIFQRRQQLTKGSRAASSLLADLGAPAAAPAAPRPTTEPPRTPAPRSTPRSAPRRTRRGLDATPEGTVT